SESGKGRSHGRITFRVNGGDQGKSAWFETPRRQSTVDCLPSLARLRVECLLWRSKHSKCCRLTDKGRKQLLVEESQWKQMAEAVSLGMWLGRRGELTLNGGR